MTPTRDEPADALPLLGRARLGRSNVEVSRFILGGAPLGGMYAPVDDASAHSALVCAWSAGVRTFDTAPHYGAGLSERRMGQFLATKPRSDFVLSTKVGRLLVPAMDDAPDPDGGKHYFGTPLLRRIRDYSASGVRRSLEESLVRLDLERVDVALVHDPDEHFREALEEALPALSDLRAAGLVGAIGVGMNQAKMLEDFVSHTNIDCVMVSGRYSLLDQQAGARLLPLCAGRGVSVLVGGVFNSGILADPGAGAMYDYAPATPGMIERVARVREVCDRYDVPLTAAAINFPLRHPAVAGVVIGARSAEEVQRDVRALMVHVPDALFAELEHLGLVTSFDPKNRVAS